MKINKWVAVMAIGALILGASLISRELGQKNASEALSRLQVVWPDVMVMPERDRALLASLSFSCSLHEVAPERGTVIDCLQDALSADPTLPKEMTKDLATTRFAELVAQAEERKQL